MCKKKVASVGRFDEVVPLSEFRSEDDLSGKSLLVRFFNLKVSDMGKKPR